MVRNALIAGATGLIGNELVSLLISDNHYTSIHLLTRRPYNFPHPKITTYLVDFENLDHFKPDVQIHDVYICLGTTMKKAGSKENFLRVDSDYIMTVANWSKKNNIEKLAFVSSVGAKVDSKNFYLATKGKVENMLINLQFQQLVILRPSLLLGKRTEFRLTEKLGAYAFKALNPLFIGRLKRFRAVEASQVAKAMLFYSVRPTVATSVIENEKIINLSV